MKNLTTPKAILCGLALIALAIASIPYSPNIVSPARAKSSDVQKVVIFDPEDTHRCVDVMPFFKRGMDSKNYLMTNTRAVVS